MPKKNKKMKKRTKQHNLSLIITTLRLLLQSSLDNIKYISFAVLSVTMASTIEFRDYDVPLVVDTNNDHDDEIVIENNYNHIIISNHQYRECILLLSKTNNNNNRSGLKNRNGGNNIDRGNLDLSWKSIMKYNSKNIVHDDVEDYGMTTEQHQIKNNELINDNTYNTRRNQRQTNKLIRSLTVMKNQWTYQCCKVVKDLFLPVG